MRNKAEVGADHMRAG